MTRKLESGKVRIEAVVAADIQRLTDLIRAYYRYDRIPFDRQGVRSGLQTFLRGKRLGRAWFIFRGRRRAGYIILTFGFDLEFGGRQATITDFYIEPATAGKVWGEKLFAWSRTFP
jgi:hypothetical protein